jgi:ABC-type nitrate/sulfonate/bicarbonate transport system substrate-binding protein
VPEHFNLPWKLLIESNTLNKDGITIEWVDNPSGTGAICNELKEGKIDVAVLLLEGAIKNIHEGMQAKIVTTYVDSPLIWGVHSAAKSDLTKENLINPSFAISRPTSGSHLMAFLYAKHNNLPLSNESFNVINDLEGAKKVLPKNMNQLFLWEKYTTKPIVDIGTFNRIDICPTPWPAFVIVVSKEALKNNRNNIEHLITKVQEEAQKLKSQENAHELIAKRYHIKPEDAKLWLNDVEWANTINIEDTIIDETVETLLDIGILKSKPDNSILLDNTHPVKNTLCSLQK